MWRLFHQCRGRSVAEVIMTTGDKDASRSARSAAIAAVWLDSAQIQAI